LIATRKSDPPSPRHRRTGRGTRNRAGERARGLRIGLVGFPLVPVSFLGVCYNMDVKCGFFNHELTPINTNLNEANGGASSGLFFNRGRTQMNAYLKSFIGGNEGTKRENGFTRITRINANSHGKWGGDLFTTDAHGLTRIWRGQSQGKYIRRIGGRLSRSLRAKIRLGKLSQGIALLSLGLCSVGPSARIMGTM
jgi:hypothetical protein